MLPFGGPMDHGLVGQRIDHRYKLVREIGAGGMATVLEAIDANLDKRVAVKILNPCYRSDPILVARFQREARAMARVRHPNLVDVTHHGLTDDGIPFLVMEFLDGWDLLGELERVGGPLPWERALGIALQACGALSAAHGAGIIHRDIKPSNCFLAGIRGEGPMLVKLLDLGIAKLLDDDDSDGAELTVLSGGIPGTLHYMAPEQIRGESVDARTDVYSLGVVLYRMLVGKLPFVDSKGATYEIMRMHCEDPPPPLRTAAPDADIPASVEPVVLRALAKDPAERWQSAADFAAALVAARHEGAVTTTSPPLRRAPPRRAAPMLALGLGVVGVVAFGLLLSLQDESPAPAPPGSSAPLTDDAERTGAPRTEAQATTTDPPQALRTASQHAEERGPSGQLADTQPGDQASSTRSEDSTEVADASLICGHAPGEHDDARDEELPAIEAAAPAAPEVEASEPPPTAARKPRPRRRKAAPPKPSPDELALTGELALYGHKFKRCSDLIADEESRTVRFGLTLQPRSGNVLKVSSDPKGPPKVNACVASILRTMHFHKAPDGGEFEHLSLSL